MRSFEIERQWLGGLCGLRLKSTFVRFQKQIHRCKGIVIGETGMACFQKSNKKWLHDGRSKLADASTSRSIGHGAGDAGVTWAVLWRSSRVIDWVHEVSSKSLAIDSKKNGLHSFSKGTKNDQVLSWKAPQTPALIQSVITLPYGMLLLRSFHDNLRHEKIFPLVCLWKQ